MLAQIYEIQSECVNMLEKTNNKLSNSGSHHVVEIDPELAEVHAKMGMLYAERKSWPESMAYYQRAIALSPNSVETYRKLAQVWLQLDKKTEAIASLEKAIALEVELEDSQELYQKAEVWAKVGDNLANAERWDEAIVHYQRAIEIEPTYHQSYQNVGIAFAKVGKIEDAIATYRRAVELAPESGHEYYLLGLSLARIGQEEDAIATFRRAGELLEQQGQIELAIDAYQEILKLASNGDISFKLGMLHAQCGQFSEALTQYQQALQSQSGNPENYAKLAVILVRQGLGEQVINCYNTVFQNKPGSAKYYHNLGMFLSQEGLIDDAVTCFRAVKKQPTEAEIYDTIWKSLNDLGQFDEHDPFYQIEIKLESAVAHFSQTSQYRVIQIWSLTEGDQEFLSSAGLSIEYLELMGRSDPAIEQIYVNSFLNDKPINFFTEEDRAITTKIDNHYFQQSIAETGYFHIICPHSGRILRSNQSFSMHCKPGYHRYQRNIYRFVGTEVFYLMCSPYSWQKNFIYFPKNDIIIILRPDVMSLKDYVLFSSLKAYAVSCWQNFKNYISYEKSKKSAILLGVLANIAHYLWIEIGGCEFLSQAGRLQKIEYFITGTWDYLKIGLLFPEISPERIIPFPDNCDDFMIFQMLLKENYFVLTPSDFILTEKFVQQRIYPACVKKCSESFLQTCEEATTHFPLFLIQIRSHKRLWLSQVEGTANIIKKLYVDYPNLAVVFDGWTRVDGVEDPDEEAQIQRDQVVVDSIISLIPSTIPVYSTVGSTVYETIMFTKAIDLYMAIVGTGNTFEWIANKPGVVYLNTAMHKANVMRQVYLRENVIVPAIVSIDHIYNETNPADWNSNFDYDWQVIYDEVLKLLQSMEVKKQGDQNMQQNNEDKADIEIQQIQNVHKDREQLISTLSKNLKINYTLAESMAQSGKFQEAIVYYRQFTEVSSQLFEASIQSYQEAIKVQPSLIDTYFKLEISLAQAGMIDRVISGYQQALSDASELVKHCHRLGIRLSELGLINEAAACFRAAQTPPTQGQCYEKIWNSLHGFDYFDENDPYYQAEIQKSDVYEYFKNTSEYTEILYMDSLTDRDKTLLDKSGVSVATLDLIKHHNLPIEEIYMRNFDDLAQSLSEGQPGRENRLRLYQENLVETGYIYTVCPLSGKILRTNQSFFIHHMNAIPIGIYRFVGQQIFYLVFTGFPFQVIEIYFPNQSLIINFSNSPYVALNNTIFLSEFKALAVTYWRQVKHYIEDNEKKPVANVLGWMSNWGHYIWNELSYMQYYYNQKKLGKINKFFVKSNRGFTIDDIYPEVQTFSLETGDQLFKEILEQNVFALRIADVLQIKEEFADRLYLACQGKCTQNFLEQVNQAKKHFPLILIWIRSHYRVWLSQIDGIANIINRLSAEFPNLGIIFDGWGRGESYDQSATIEIERVNETIQQILPLIDHKIYIYNSNGSMNFEKAVWSRAIDFYIAPAGSNLTFPIWIGGKPGVVHGTNLSQDEFVTNHWSSAVRENAVDAIALQPNEIDSENPIVYNYDMDWHRIYDEIVKIIRESSPGIA
ncbi:MAG: tetratricopeptide repeat protein [Microcoleus sp.]